MSSEGDTTQTTHEEASGDVPTPETGAGAGSSESEDRGAGGAGTEAKTEDPEKSHGASETRDARDACEADESRADDRSDPARAASFPPSMTAVVIARDGRPGEALQVRSDLATCPAQLGPTEVLVRVRAVSVNPVDVKRMKGNTKLLESKAAARIPGGDFAGEVVAAGPRVTGFAAVPGQRVVGMVSPLQPRGTFAEFVLCAAADMAPLPDSVSFAEAAALPICGLTGWLALRETARLVQGERLLVFGGSSGTGSIAVQLAKAIGATVVATCGARNAELVRGLGADEVVDYRDPDFRARVVALGPFDVVYDCVGGRAHWDIACEACPARARFVTLTGDTSADEAVRVGALLSTAATVAGRGICSFIGRHPSYSLVFGRPNGQWMAQLIDLVAAGKIKPVIENAYTGGLADVIAAAEHVATGHAVGKVVVCIGD